ncbi:hypothetical protein J8N05_45950 [Streptomyces sp. BH-SS-21]|uniref:Uncharacterized protein n=1 Tax=Streptomyces liliiviolaceus TaxID=2823109 RepID=A0A940Y1B9_9ACTN|nr:hypothetical protein [Streptomyces liliiviolaceus]MBQ0855514.1 hypothetical protein [Streptomyces liliiviolaceus]
MPDLSRLYPVAACDRRGFCRNFGDIERGPVVVDPAIAARQPARDVPGCR